jgi:hypothetical protein
MKHVLILDLNSSYQDLERVIFLTKLSGQLHNAVLGTMIGRVN